MNRGVLLSFTAQDLLDIQQCILDDDSEGALEFLTKVVVPQIEKASGRRPSTDRQETNGQLLGQRGDNVSEA